MKPIDEPTWRARTTRRLARAITALTLACAPALALAGCGNVTAGGVTGDTDIYMTGDADGGGAAAAPERAPRTQADTTPETTAPLGAVVGAGLEGEVQVTADLYLSDAGGAPVSLTPDGPVTVTLDLAGAQEPRVARQAVTLGSYDGLRVVFTDVVADVTAGLEIAGVTFTGPVTVDLGGDALTVERTLTLTVDPDRPLAVLVDLNAAAWLDLLDPVTGTVTGADFAGAIQVSVR